MACAGCCLVCGLFPAIALHGATLLRFLSYLGRYVERDLAVLVYDLSSLPGLLDPSELLPESADSPSRSRDLDNFCPVALYSPRNGGRGRPGRGFMTLNDGCLLLLPCPVDSYNFFVGPPSLLLIQPPAR